MGDLWRLPPVGVSAVVTEDWKMTRRKEQCRINQANYRKRKRQHEHRLSGEITVLEHDIQELQNRRATVFQNGRPNPIKAIGDFYFALGVEGEQQRVDHRNYRMADGSPPALQNLLDLQREEFDSIDSLKRHWISYNEQFRVFQLSIVSSKRLEAGEHVIIEIIGQLQLDVYYDNNHGEAAEGYGVIVCPIVQQFEFETGKQLITRITSEVDLIAGIAADHAQSSPECTVSVLHAFSVGFTMSNRYLKNN